MHLLMEVGLIAVLALFASTMLGIIIGTIIHGVTSDTSGGRGFGFARRRRLAGRRPEERSSGPSSRPDGEAGPEDRR